MSGLLVIGGGPALVQDGGRPGLQHQGLPAGGALVRELLAAANLSLGNHRDAAAIELYGRLVVEARGALSISLDGVVHELASGARLDATPEGRRVCYLAVVGGLEVPVVLGGRGTLLCAGLGGHDGRLLRAGDLLRAAALLQAPTQARAHEDRARLRRALVPPRLDPTDPIRVIPGPDTASFPPAALALLLGAPFRAGRGDRTGVRLEGPALPRCDDDAGLSAPMAPGALQVTGSGEAIVLGPDHPTTGGYPVLAVVCSADLGALLARPAGAVVRFTAIDLEEARALRREREAERA